MVILITSMNFLKCLGLRFNLIFYKCIYYYYIHVHVCIMPPVFFYLNKKKTRRVTVETQGFDLLSPNKR